MTRSNYKLPRVADGAQTDLEYDEYISSDEAQLQGTESTPPHKNLKKFRLEKKYKKQEMATFMRVTSRTYYAYEEGLRAIPSNALTSLAATTDVDLHFILTGHKATNDAKTVRIAIADAHIIDRQLISTYPDMDTACLLYTSPSPRDRG